MSKKSYKRMQNRLYREIKRRIIAENSLSRPVRLIKCERNIETIRVKNIIPDYLQDTKEYIEVVRSDIANQITEKLIKDHYIKFDCYKKCYHTAEDEIIMNVSEIEATLNVVRPWG